MNSSNTSVNTRHATVHIALAGILLLIAPSALPQDLVLWNGGFGADERAQAPRQGTRLEFFAERGEFVAGVQVQIKDASGKVLVATDDAGPWLILDLPPGRYQVEARKAGSVQSAMIEVGSGRRTFGFRFTLE